MVSLGGFILFFGFLAFNGGAQVSISADGDATVVALAIVNTILSGRCKLIECENICQQNQNGIQLSCTQREHAYFFNIYLLLHDQLGLDINREVINAVCL